MNPLWLLGGIGAAVLMVTPTGQREARRIVSNLPKPKEPTPFLHPLIEPFRFWIKRSSAANQIDFFVLASIVYQESKGNITAKHPDLVPSVELRNPNTPKRRKIKQQWLALGWTEDDMADAWGLTGMTGLVAALELYWVGTKAQLLEPHRNIELSARWVRILLKKYGNYPQALAAYNGGQGTARSYPNCGFPCKTYAPEVWNRALYWKKLTETKR